MSIRSQDVDQHPIQTRSLSYLYESYINRLNKSAHTCPSENAFQVSLLLFPAYKKPHQWHIKRVFDFCSALFGMILISPLLLMVCIAIKLDSHGPVLFKQKRVGLNGKEFYMYKFRSMYADAERNFSMVKHLNDSNNVMFKAKNDPRVTRVGKFIRKFSIDELPQLINVLKGEMSLVGPRPPLVSEVKEYASWHYARLGTVPGLTGLWQVSGRSDITDFNKVVALDIFYIRNWSFLFDIQLLFRTVPVVIFGRNAA